ncbi:hypothetical protein KLEP7_gp157 [Pseudaeromonas phage vB_PpeM_ KLEP7]|nr:hypothetical protein KLEP7_gp157 [Pseudaeromonas phage vB_PpeM_ KLEP7]
MKISIKQIMIGLWFCSFIMILAKLFGIISFSWWLATSPIWFTLIIVIVSCASLFVFLLTRSDEQLDKIEERIEKAKIKYGIK